jgi:hypothetical protein
LYIVDVNDSTFTGPKCIADAIKKHQQLYEGNRNIMNLLPELTTPVGLVAHDSAPDDADVILSNEVFISLFDFIGLRQDMALDYQALMGIEIQTQVYRRA